MNAKSFLAALAAAACLNAAPAGEPAAPAVIHIDHEKVAAAFAKGGPLLQSNNFKVQAGRRQGPGIVELHERDTDIFYILEGSATFVTGGKAIEPKTVSPGEIRAREITGGESRRLAKGDIIVIPNGVPHWFKEVDGTFQYYIVKVSQ